MQAIREPHQIELSALFQQLDCSSQGLSSASAEQRLTQYGFNQLQVRKETPELIKFLRQFGNFFALLLLGGASLAFIADYLQPGEGNLYIAIALLVVVLLNASFTYLQERASDKIMASFRDMLPSKIAVLRDGKVMSLETRLLVPGDVILLTEGDRIPADARLLSVSQLKVDHASLTGESEPQLRCVDHQHHNVLDSRNLVFSGTLVQSGNGQALVYATGMNTQMGHIVQLTKQTSSNDTPIRRELRHFIRIISSIAIALGLIFFLLSVWFGNPLIGSVIFAIGIIVANVPEGLLPTVTLALTMASKRMAKKNALIKHLEAVETLGSTTVICTDKTGTITQNKMTVSTVAVAQQLWQSNQAELDQTSEFQPLKLAMILCNNAHDEQGLWQGDPTETALLQFAHQLQPINTILKQYPRQQEQAFDSRNKRMLTLNRNPDGQWDCWIKGAPEVVFASCSHYWEQGQLRPFDAATRERAQQHYEQLANQGQRVLAFAQAANCDATLVDQGLIYLGLVGLIDPPRPEIPAAIAKCRSAGIRVFMITGDYHLTARAIAQQVGMLGPEGTVVTGEQLAQMDNPSLLRLLAAPELVFSRTTPEQKLRIVQGLQQLDQIVTVTGDGVNDAPALKHADMGVAMGLSGTEVAKEASDMVLMDDNFATIVNAIEEGRTIFANIKKFIAYILTSNVPEILPFIAFVLIDAPLALTVILILTIDLGTDILPALGLGQEKPEHDVMQQAPRRRDERLLSWNLLGMSYGIIGLIQAAAGFFCFFTVLFNGGWQWGQTLASDDQLYRTAVTAFFAAVVICQVADVMICRTRRQSILSAGIFSNRLIWLGITVELAIVYAVSQIPALYPFFGTAAIGWYEISLALPFALFIVIADEYRRWLIRRNNRFVSNYLSW